MLHAAVSSAPCPGCGAYVLPAGRVCPDCGYVYPITTTDDQPNQSMTEADWSSLLTRIDAEADHDSDA